MQKTKKLFALDIGTRSVVGIILEKTDEQYRVVEILSIEHSERAMLDGQIHDVLAVAKIINEIKETLEKKHGPLNKVCVAAAGRALKTERSKVTVNIKGKTMMQKQDILHLELSAVQQAQAAVAEKNQIDKSYYYYCVGYSILYYRLDGEEIGNLIDQHGDEASVEIIATFLPKVVVESLLAALSRANLEMEALTLEPIAAINVLIPPSMRRLNVALVDIGAGTSDIAITNMGTVIAYGMVPIAGDEITEAISDQFLLDFPLAEKAKRELMNNDTITLTDILGFSTDVKREEIISQIEPALDRLASTICSEILTLNNHLSPKAVMLVGGGSQTPELQKKIADKLQLPQNRVAIRGIDAINSLTIEQHITKGPELVTPIGIAIAAEKSPVHYKTVYINEQPVRLFEVKKLTVGDCLLASGIKISKLYGKPGMAMIVTLNKQKITIPGFHGEPPSIIRNGIPCSLDDEVKDGDTFQVEKGKDGKQAQVRLKDLIDDVPVKIVYINGIEHSIHARVTSNGINVSLDKWIEDRDFIEYKMPETIDEMLHRLDLKEYISYLKPFRININGKETFIPRLSGKVFRNGMEVKVFNNVEHLDQITIEKMQSLTIRELAEIKKIQLYQTLPILFNDKQITLVKKIAFFIRNNETLSEDDFVHDGDKITIEVKKVEPFIFQDIFNYVEIEIPSNSNGKFKLLKNGEETSFHSPLNEGDKININWRTSLIQDN